jgi:tetratricopeptide (TPR) repeat protein
VSAKHLSSLLAAAALVTAGAAALAAGSVPLGQSLTGEACRLEGGAILCGDEAAGTLRVSQLPAAMPSDQVTRRAAIAAAARALPDGLATEQDIACDAGQWIGTPGADAALYMCTLRSSNWPRVVLVAASGSTLAAAEGLPSMLPVLETALQNALGRTPAPGEVDAAVALVKARYPTALAGGSNDFAQYRHLVESARLYGGTDNYAGAEDAYRKALDIETRQFGATSLAAGETLAELALQVSNQGRFDEAAALFQRASPIIEGSASATARARLASYQALDAANQRNYADALKFARAATALRRSEVDAAKQAAASGGANGEPIAPVALEGELAHSLRIEAEMALRLGDNASAQAAAEEALWIITEEPGLPLWWRPEMLSLMGEVNAAQARVVVAERDFSDALALDQKLFGDTAPTVRAQLRLGRFYAEQQLYDASVGVFRKAFAILDKDPVARSQVVSDQIVPFLAAASALADRDPSQRAALDADMFRAVQLTTSGVADQTMARVAARAAAGDPALAALVRQFQDAQAQQCASRTGGRERQAERRTQRGARCEIRGRSEGRVGLHRCAEDQTGAELSRLHPAGRCGSRRARRFPQGTGQRRGLRYLRRRRQGQLRAGRQRERPERQTLDRNDAEPCRRRCRPARRVRTETRQAP